MARQQSQALDNETLEERDPTPQELEQVAGLMSSGQWPSQEQQDAQEDEANAAEMMRQQRLQAFGSTLGRLRDEWVKVRTAMGVDRRWAEDDDQYNGIDSATRAGDTMMDVVENGGPVKAGETGVPTRSTVFVNLTRSKTNAGEAHLSDIVLPVDERNWSIGATPNAQIAREMNDSGPAMDPDTKQQIHGPSLDVNGNAQHDEQGQPATKPYTKRDLALAIQRMADEAAEAMGREIEDQLVQCDYIAEVRKVIADAAKYGSGVIRGPVVTAKSRKAWTRSGTGQDGSAVYQLMVIEDKSPASFRRDPRFVWPDPACGDDVQNGRGVIEMEEMTAKRVRQLAKQPGYMIDQLAMVLLSGPGSVPVWVEARSKLRLNQALVEGDLYQVWTYTGEVDAEDLMAAGVPGLAEQVTAMTPQERALLSVSGEITFINNIVVKAVLNPMETGDLPYDFFQWESVADSVWGYGVPYLMRSQQRILNSSWRMMMDNAAVSVMPQIVMRRNAITPAVPGNYKVWAGKIWYANDDITEIEKAFYTFDFENHQDKLQAIIQMAQDLMDKETGQPQLAQGERGSAPETVGGMQLLMNSTNVVRRRQVKMFDDRITKRHIRRYYDFNMAYSDKEEIKGDFMVDARGSSALLVRDIQNQAFLSLLQTASNPLFGKFTDLRKLYAKALQAQHIKAEDILKTEDQVEREEEAAKQNPPPKDPRIEAAEIMAQSRADVAKLTAQTRGEEAQVRSESLQGEMQMRRDMLEMEHQLEMLKMANSKGVTLDQIKADLAKTAMTLRSQDRRFDDEAALRRTTGEGI